MGLIGRGFRFQVPHHCPTHVITEPLSNQPFLTRKCNCSNLALWPLLKQCPYFTDLSKEDHCKCLWSNKPFPHETLSGFLKVI